MERFPLPTICALNGGVYGGSTDLALGLRLPHRGGGDGDVHARRPARPALLRGRDAALRRPAGAGAAKRLFLTGGTLDTAELLRIGYLDEAVPAERLMARVGELAATLAANAPIAVQGMKRCLNDIARGEPDFALIAANQKRSRESADLAEGRAAWLEKRTPRFTGA